MTYARLLLLFVLAPTLMLSVAIAFDRRRKRHEEGQAPLWPQLAVLLALMGVATLYTLPWDDHLIAVGVWWYKPALLLGAYLGHIPIEEALFFPSQTLLVGMWWIWLTGRASPARNAIERDRANNLHGAPRRAAVGAAGAAVWLGALALLGAGWRPVTYVGWELAWALPPLLVQVLVGGDILWQRWRLVWWVAVPVALYLSCVDALAIHLGIWTIDPRQSLGVVIGGWLPIEELLFFLLTSALVSFGLVLGVAEELRIRTRAMSGSWRVRLAGPRAQRRKEQVNDPA